MGIWKLMDLRVMANAHGPVPSGNLEIYVFAMIFYPA